MFPIEIPWRWLQRVRSSRIARIGVVSLGLGLGTAMATELTITPTPEASASSPEWSYFDPGFLVDHLPFKLTIGQSISYNDNVANLPNNTAALVTGNGLSRLPSRGDFYSDTTIGIASRFPLGAQNFFFNGTYAPRRFLTYLVKGRSNKISPTELAP